MQYINNTYQDNSINTRINGCLCGLNACIEACGLTLCGAHVCLGNFCGIN